MYNEFEIRQLPLSLKVYRQQAERFLTENGLRLDDVDYYAGVFACEEDTLLAGGGLKGNVIKCIAVDGCLRDEGISNRLVSHLISVAHERGHLTVKVFTKPENQTIFESLSFRLLATAPKAILMETGNGLQDYCHFLSANAQQSTTNTQHPTPITKGAIVMNANPFTLGHRYLIEQAACQVDHLYVIAVREDLSLFGYTERLAMIQAACKDMTNVTVVEGSEYAISSSTFPTYFLKKLSDASDTQMALDLDLFARHIAPSLGATVRFIGSEPTDELTRRYNELMKELLPTRGIEVVEIERKRSADFMDGKAISASMVREQLKLGSFQGAAQLVPPTTLPYLIAHLATTALQTELDTTPKPGLVDKHDNGAHHDMDFELMQQSIRALHPYFVKLSSCGFQKELPTISLIQRIGLEAEQTMLQATNNVNTHKGALFSMGLCIVAAAHLAFHQYQRTDLSDKGEAADINASRLQATIVRLASGFHAASDTHGSMVTNSHAIRGALANAQAGYPELFADWLPYYIKVRAHEYGLHKTLLRIMTQLDDTNIYYRKDAETVGRVKAEAQALLEAFTTDGLSDMNSRFIHENISPGGSADMLSLTVFIDSILS